jgi:hypothetical protein
VKELLAKMSPEDREAFHRFGQKSLADVLRRLDDDGSAGVREPRRPRSPAGSSSESASEDSA